jgi:hypothetical protein
MLQGEVVEFGHLRFLEKALTLTRRVSEGAFLLF